MIIHSIFINQYIRQKTDRLSMSWMLKGEGGRTLKSFHKEVANLDEIGRRSGRKAPSKQKEFHEQR